MDYNQEKTSSGFFSSEDSDKIVLAIRNAEGKTSAQIRLHIEDRCIGDPLERAREVFHLLDMDTTTLRNGVLLYLSVLDRRIAVFGDKGIDEKVPAGFWDNVVAVLAGEFRKQNFLHGILRSLGTIGDQLALLYPLQGDAKNELADEISFGGN